jgi:shikimate dehydrogenase
MKQFYSLSKYPGKTGEHYFNSLFKKYDLPYTYTALACDDIAEGVQRMRDCNAAGFSVSMPYKRSVIGVIDFADNIVFRYNSCNTVYNLNGKLHGYNSDFYGAQRIIADIPENSKISILGDGAMGSMFAKMLGDRAIVYARNLGNWDLRYKADDVIINCTSFGTTTADSPFEVLPPINLVIDLAIKSNQLEQQAIKAGVKYIGGIEFYKYQFIKQFGIYTKRGLISIEEVNSI